MEQIVLRTIYAGILYLPNNRFALRGVEDTVDIVDRDNCQLTCRVDSGGFGDQLRCAPFLPIFDDTAEFPVGIGIVKIDLFLVFNVGDC